MTDIKALARTLRDEYGTRNPFELARQLGIHTICCPLPDSVRGFYHMMYDEKLIYVNDSLEGAPRLETCAHELGHSLLHPELNTLFIRANTDILIGRYEKEAELFSVFLLYDDPFPCGV